ncbi:MAG: long-chain fatty acid--CoA ligase [Deltaproteobacteria bacterium]|jgi:fatty-acyl-CoA synthase|nr:long-chain fatty acid--CoA ligase [Deltaproteobacteria bacterium]MDX9760757.1 long-chain fatty acid--CoA ligase [Desulfomonilia bacterium]HPW69296.1 long-chain fatty acid--CoA ligase [Deltaproteobacteria bacterium]
MMDYPLLLRTYLIRTAKYFSKKEIVSVYPDETFRYDYGEYYRRVCRLAHALKSLGIRRSDRVASIALNDHRHLELYFGVPCYGAVLHTVNFRLPPRHLIHIINHAQDRIVFVDEDLLMFIEPLKDQLKTVEKFVVLSHTGTLPQTSIENIVLYDDLIEDFPDEYDFPDNLSEHDPAMICYTSATTGDPKGVVYSHRAIVLHSLTVGITFGAGEPDCILHIVPMFHANAWCAPFAGLIAGCKQVLPGREVINMEKLCRMIADEKVTFTAGVPTIWMLLFDYLEKGGRHDFSSLKTIVSGGAAMPLHLLKAFNEKYNFPIKQAYGATETTPLVSAALPKSYMTGRSDEELYDIRTSVGLLVMGLEMKIVGTDGVEVEMDGKQWGEIWLRGPWIANEYYRDPERSKDAFAGGWYHTGDVATIDREGYIRLVDRTRDLVKSAGEWISSVDLENLIMEHPGVAEAAIIGVPHPKWQERPLACVSVLEGQSVTADDLKAFLKDKVRASWWIPDDFVFLAALPKTSVGKFDKRELRRLYAEGELGAV